MGDEDLTDIVLLGFSYGGAVVTGALERNIGDRVRSLVFLDAFVPADGDSVDSLRPHLHPGDGRSGGRRLARVRGGRRLGALLARLAVPRDPDQPPGAAQPAGGTDPPAPRAGLMNRARVSSR